MMSKGARLGVAAIVIAITLTACTPSTLAVFIPDDASLCSDSNLTRTASLGVPLTNTSSNPITLTYAGPMAVSNLDVLGTWIVPAVEPVTDDLVFVDEQVPGPEYVDWNRRTDPDGAVIEPGEVAYLVIAIGLADTQDSGWIEGVQATTDQGVKNAPHTGFGLTPGGDRCPWSPPDGMPEPSPTVTP
jgi:hypothetical protein